MERAHHAARGPLIDARQVAVSGGRVKVPVGEVPRKSRPAGGAAPKGGQPEVNVVRAADGAVQRIVVHCTCGREITLECDYLGVDK